MNKKSKKMTVVKRVEDVPEFASEAEEHRYWETHQFAPELFSKANNKVLLDLPLKRSKERTSGTRPISLRLERDLDARLREVARRKGANYQTLLKDFVLERVYEEEKRLGIIK
jgi:CopG antitoxin of type II toxin-antitoxin system